MKKPSSAITLDEWRSALAEVDSASREVVPPGWITAPQYAAQAGISQSTARCAIRKLMAAGRAEKRSFTVATTGRGFYPTPHFRLIRRK